MQLEWIKSTKDNWLPLETFNIESAWGFGVYTIWRGGGGTPLWVKVGQGDIKDRLTTHRGDKAILKYNAGGTLYVTWAAVPASQVDGVERYLGEQLDPVVAERFPDALPIRVNLPQVA